MHGLILYGPPGAGKDTITDELHKLDNRYVLFPRLKLGPGRTAGYRMTSRRKLATLRAQGQIIYENQRYDATYAIDRPALLAHLAEHVPVVHAGQLGVIDAVTEATTGVQWTVVYLWCPPDIATARLTARGSDDLADRLQAWNETRPMANAHLTINTARVTPDQAAEEIRACVTALAGRRVSPVGQPRSMPTNRPCRPYDTPQSNTPGPTTA